MNFLFYVGIIIPTVITITLFLVFIYCWFVQKARKEVLTKKYDPHGKMRRLGISMDPPPPPSYCRMDDSLILDNGEDNVAYDVSRSPSTEQDGRGRPMYHTYHDSGISAGLSPGQESEPRPGLAYRTCPDSGISGFGPQLSQCSYHANRVCCEPDEPFQRQPYQHVYADHIHVNANQHLPYNQQLPQAALHQNLVQASVHPTHGVCYGDDMSHPQSPQHYNPPLAHPTSLSLANYNDRHINLVAHIHRLPTQSIPSVQQLSGYQSSPGYQIHPQNSEQCYHLANSIQEHAQINTINSPKCHRGQDITISPSTTEVRIPDRTISLPSVNFHHQPDKSPDNHDHQYKSSPSSPTKPIKHVYKDSCPVSSIQPPPTNPAERPDSQASQSSTTDSEDSGFRSSHCAAHHKARLSKLGNPLLKPLRRTKNNKTKFHKPCTYNSDGSNINGITPLITLNPQNLQSNIDRSNVIQNTSLVDLQMVQRPSRLFPMQSSNLRNNSCSNDRAPVSSSSASQIGVSSVNIHDGSPKHQHSPNRDNWPSQSVNDEEGSVKQNIDLNDISTHLSWKYLQDLSSNNNAYNGPTAGSIVLQACHQGMRSGQIHHTNQDPHIEMFGFSVV